MSTTTTSGTRRKTTSASNPFAPGATIGEKRVERWRPVEASGLNPKRLDLPLRWRNERFVVVNCDLFHESLSDEAIAAVFGVMSAAPWHTFQVLTKRPERMRAWFEWIDRQVVSTAPGVKAWPIYVASFEACRALGVNYGEFGLRDNPGTHWPLPNVWLGVSVENQATADERIPLLLQTPAAKRFVSYEPALGPVDFGRFLGGRTGAGSEPLSADGKTSCWQPEGRGLTNEGSPVGVPEPNAFQHYTIDAAAAAEGLCWLIVGGESGPGARPFDVAWARSTVEKCKAAGVAVFVKQLGSIPIIYRAEALRVASSGGRIEWDDSGEQTSARLVLRDRKGGDWNEWPEDLRVREFPAFMLKEEKL